MFPSAGAVQRAAALSRRTLSALFCTLLACSHGASAQQTATCVVQAGSGTGNVAGKILLSQSVGANITFTVSLTGFSTTGTPMSHGFHVHQNPSLGNLCTDAGPHFNIESTLHGAPTDLHTMRHTGDLGNIPVDAKGNVDNLVITDWLMSLSGPTSIIGKPIVIHAGVDDLGRGGSPLSNTTGNAGARLGCCLITASPAPYNAPGGSGALRPLSGLAAALLALSEAWLGLTDF
jgi:Cu-Zn family superoxide dismutase